MKITSKSVKDTLRLGSQIARHVKPGDIICLKGELGSGKTVLTKGIAQGLGINKSKVASSSFILIRQHQEGRLALYHFDLYRLREAGDIAALGYEEYFYGQGLAVIEWAERLEHLMPKERLMVELTYQKEGKRGLRFSAIGIRHKELLRRVRESRTF